MPGATRMRVPRQIAHGCPPTSTSSASPLGDGRAADLATRDEHHVRVPPGRLPHAGRPGAAGQVRRVGQRVGGAGDADGRAALVRGQRLARDDPLLDLPRGQDEAGGGVVGDGDEPALVLAVDEPGAGLALDDQRARVLQGLGATGAQQAVHGEADAQQDRHHDPGQEPDVLAAQRPLRLVGLGPQQGQPDALQGEAVGLVKVALAVHSAPLITRVPAYSNLSG
ncbi:hypothetical protein GCM10020220_031210 [Nonomuraea rubra]